MFEKDPKTVEMGKVIYPFEMGYLPDFFKAKAEKELNDTPENRRKGLEVLKKLIDSDKNFSDLKLDDDLLTQYLRCKKFNAKRAFAQLKALVNLRKSYKNVFTDIHFENIAISTKNKIVTFLPYRCQDGCAIMLVQVDNWIPEEFPVEEIKRMAIIFLLQSSRDPMTQVNGYKVILDVKCNPIRHLKYVTPSNMYLMYHGTQECSAGRFTEFHVVNLSIVFRVAWSFLSLFASSKLKRRTFFHNTPEGLLKHFPASILPVQYGGELKDYDMTDWLRKSMSPEKVPTFLGGKYPLSSQTD